MPVKQGDLLRVRSKRDGNWHEGTVLGVQDDVVSLEYITSGGSKTNKALKIDHPDLDVPPELQDFAMARVVVIRSFEGNSASPCARMLHIDERGTVKQIVEKGHAYITFDSGDQWVFQHNLQNLRVVSTEAAPRKNERLQRLSSSCIAGEVVEVWSKSWKTWSLGSVLRRGDDRYIVVEYTPQGAFSSIVKALPLDHEDLRPAAASSRVAALEGGCSPGAVDKSIIEERATQALRAFSLRTGQSYPTKTGSGGLNVLPTASEEAAATGGAAMAASSAEASAGRQGAAAEDTDQAEPAEPLEVDVDMQGLPLRGAAGSAGTPPRSSRGNTHSSSNVEALYAQRHGSSCSTAAHLNGEADMGSRLAVMEEFFEALSSRHSSIENRLDELDRRRAGLGANASEGVVAVK